MNVTVRIRIIGIVIRIAVKITIITIVTTIAITIIDILTTIILITVITITEYKETGVLETPMCMATGEAPAFLLLICNAQQGT